MIGYHKKGTITYMQDAPILMSFGLRLLKRLLPNCMVAMKQLKEACQLNQWLIWREDWLKDTNWMIRKYIQPCISKGINFSWYFHEVINITIFVVSWLVNIFVSIWNRYLRRSFAAQAFITCSRKGDWREANKADLNGLVQGHAYTITGNFI